MAMALVASVFEAAQAVRVYQEDSEPVFSPIPEDMGQGLESVADEEGSEALYYDPKEQVIYEITSSEAGEDGDLPMESSDGADISQNE